MAKATQQQEWVSLSEAAELLGVHPATVRNWADRGDLPTRRTRGGHRRFRRSDLEHWLETRQTPPPAEVQMLIQSALGQMRLRIGEGEMRQLDWYGVLSEDAREVMRQKGRQMLEALKRYLAEGAAAPQETKAVRELGQEYARFLIGQGLTLTQALQGFLFFNNFLHEAALNIVEVAGIRMMTECLGLLRQVRGFTNTLLLSLTEVYERQER